MNSMTGYGYSEYSNSDYILTLDIKSYNNRYLDISFSCPSVLSPFEIEVTEIIKKTVKLIEDAAREVEIGKVYNVKVTSVQDFGAFVELWPGCEGMCHVSQLAYEHVDNPSDLYKIGDSIIVKALGYDNKGRLNLSRKEALPPRKTKKDDK